MERPKAVKGEGRKARDGGVFIHMHTPVSISFAVEKPLGKLAKWLRILGFDTIYEQDVTSIGFKNIKNRGRIRLTRTRGIRGRHQPTECLTIFSDHVHEQLKEVIHALGLNHDDIQPFSRCIRCNSLIRKIEKSHVATQVPDYIFETRNAFRICNQCGRIYWRGSHSRRIDGIIMELFKVK